MNCFQISNVHFFRAAWLEKVESLEEWLFHGLWVHGAYVVVPVTLEKKGPVEWKQPDGDLAVI